MMGKKFDISQMLKLKDGFIGVQEGFNDFVKDFLIREGIRVLRNTKLLTPSNTGFLRKNWELSAVHQDGDELYIVLFNNAEYASFVEDGYHQKPRFVPGEFNGNQFEYIPDHKSGMMLTDKWIPGQHMARISMAKVEAKIPQRFNKAFKDYMKSKGVSD
jgi:hypothetical protein